VSQTARSWRDDLERLWLPDVEPLCSDTSNSSSARPAD